MPTTYAHYKFGKEVLSALPRPLQNSIEAHRELFDIGLHGPDILFYYNALKKDPVNEQGHTLHEQFADEFFHHAVEVIEKVTEYAVSIRFKVKAVEFSPIKGPEGNIEYLVHLQKCPPEEAKVEEGVRIRQVTDAAFDTRA